MSENLLAKKETEKRLSIVNYIAKDLKKITECMILGGSMGYGQNYSVAPWCDINMVLVIDKANLDYLLDKPFFNQTIDDKTIDLFKTGKIGMFWSKRLIRGIETEVYVYERDSFIDFCTLKKDLVAFIPYKPRDKQLAFTFSGEKIFFDRNVRPFGSGYLYDKPALANGVYWGGVPHDDFFFCNYLVYDKNDFYSDLSNEVWSSVIKQLVKEHGLNVDIEKFNVLNSMYTYQTNRIGLPKAIIEKIKQRTLQELEKVALSDISL